jgi:hypothetical protein
MEAAAKLEPMCREAAEQLREVDYCAAIAHLTEIIEHAHHVSNLVSILRDWKQANSKSQGKRGSQ